MSVVCRNYDEEFKKNAAKQAATDMGIAASLLFRRRQRYTSESDPKGIEELAHSAGLHFSQ